MTSSLGAFSIRQATRGDISDLMTVANTMEMPDMRAHVAYKAAGGSYQPSGSSSDNLEGSAGEGLVVPTSDDLMVLRGENARRRRRHAQHSELDTPVAGSSEEESRMERFALAQIEHHAATFDKLCGSPSSTACSDPVITPLLLDETSIEPTTYFPKTQHPIPPPALVAARAGNASFSTRTTPASLGDATNSARQTSLAELEATVEEFQLVEGCLDLRSPFPLPIAALPAGERHNVGVRGFGLIPSMRHSVAGSTASSYRSEILQSRFSFGSSTQGSVQMSSTSQRSSSSTRTARPVAHSPVNISQLAIESEVQCPHKFGARRDEPRIRARNYGRPRREAARCAANFAFAPPSPVVGRASMDGVEAAQRPAYMRKSPYLGSGGAAYGAPVVHPTRLDSLPRPDNHPGHITLDEAAMAKSREPNRHGAYANSHHRPRSTITVDSITEGASQSRNEKSSSVISAKGKQTFLQRIRPEWTKGSSTSKSALPSSNSGSSLSTMASTSIQTPRCSRRGTVDSIPARTSAADGPKSILKVPEQGDGKVLDYESWTSKMKPVTAERSVDVQERIARARRPNPDPNRGFHIPDA